MAIAEAASQTGVSEEVSQELERQVSEFLSEARRGYRRSQFLNDDEALALRRDYNILLAQEHRMTACRASAPQNCQTLSEVGGWIASLSSTTWRRRRRAS